MTFLSHLFLQIKTFLLNLFRRRSRTYVFTLMGQSNMVGYNKPLDVQDDPDIMTFTLNDTLEKSTNNLFTSPSKYYELYGNPALATPFANMGTSPGVGFARELIKHLPSGDNIILVPCARGGSSMDEQLYDDVQKVDAMGNTITQKRALLSVALERTQKAMRSRPNTVFGGVLYFQGEADFFEYVFRDKRTPGVKDWSFWGEGLNHIRLAFSEQFGTCKMVFAQLADYPLFKLNPTIKPWFDTELQKFRDYQSSVSSNYHIPMVVTKDTGMDGSLDGIHLPHSACIQVGVRMADSYRIHWL